MIEIFVAGFLGGVIRGLVGISKQMRTSPSKKKLIRTDYLVVSLLAAGGLGLLVGVFIANDYRFALLAGYAGTDFLENLFKIKMKKKDW
jgi:CBS domain-containing protein